MFALYITKVFIDPKAAGLHQQEGVNMPGPAEGEPAWCECLVCRCCRRGGGCFGSWGDEGCVDERWGVRGAGHRRLCFQKGYGLGRGEERGLV